jgi:cell division transport system permease protein
MQGLKYFVREAMISLWRGRRAALLSVATIAAAVFVLGGFLVLGANLDRLVARWSAAAEFSVYWRDDATRAQQDAVDRILAGSSVVAAREPVTKDGALQRFKRDFPALARAAGSLERNPLPASVEVRLRPGADPDAVSQLAAQIAKVQGVADVRYDRQWIERVLSVVVLARGLGILLAAVLIVAACLTVANVVRLALFARLDEVRIMALVGAPMSYIRGPFVVEGILQGGLGTAMAVILLYVGFLAARARYGDAMASLGGGGTFVFLPIGLTALLVLGGLALGCVGGMVAARGARGVAAES